MSLLELLLLKQSGGVATYVMITYAATPPN